MSAMASYKRKATVEMLEEFLVAHGVQRVQGAVGKERTGFLHQAIHDHAVHPRVDACVQFVSRKVQREPEDAHVGALFRDAALGAVGLPADQAYLQCADHAVRIVAVDGIPVTGVELAQLIHEGLQSLCSEPFLQFSAHPSSDKGSGSRPYNSASM